ncbi:MAG TPA: GIY-YIG nuclease family protein [Patescibacteria group bacterium]|nr:GIY-YIG nuclease family protein [Patescibacteria group bacterium]
MYYTYILKLRNNTFYIGFSSNLKQRFQEHISGSVIHTKNLLPCTLDFYAAFTSKKKALEFERYLKTNSGFSFRNKHLV